MKLIGGVEIHSRFGIDYIFMLTDKILYHFLHNGLRRDKIMTRLVKYSVIEESYQDICPSVGGFG